MHCTVPSWWRTSPELPAPRPAAYLGYGLVSRRRTEPACQPDALPALDAVVLSHLHGDHWDRIARRALPIVTTPHAARRLQGLHRFRRALGLRTWEHTHLVPTVRPRIAVPVHHNDDGLLTSPLRDSTEQVELRGLHDRVRYVEPGQTVPLRAPAA